MTTKQQERDAIEKIRKIVADLGEDSYVGTAMTGVFEIAEQNIDMDAAFSVAEERDLAREELAEARQLIGAAREKVEQLTRDLNVANASVKYNKDRTEEWKSEAQNLRETLAVAAETNLMLEEINAAYQRQTIELKAKLYDLMVAQTA